MAYESTFKISGDVTDRRELTSDKNKAWRGYVVKVAVVGATLEVAVNEEQFKSIGVGESITVAGRIDRRGDGVVQLQATTLSTRKGAA